MNMALDAALATNPNGWQRLVQAALRLAARSRSITGLGLREIAREADLNPNTFYRHFGSVEDLALAVITLLGSDLRHNLRQVRHACNGRQEAARATIEHVLDFAERNPGAMTVAVRELHGPSPRIRTALRSLLEDTAAEMAADVQALRLAPGLEEGRVREVSRLIVEKVFFLALDFLEHRDRREALIAEALRYMDLVEAGARSLDAPGPTPPP